MNESIDQVPDAAAVGTALHRGHAPVWARVGVLGVFGLFYAYALWNAVAQIISLNSVDGMGLSGAGWALMLFSAAFPLIVLVAAGSLAWTRRLGEMVVVLLAGLGIVAVFWLNMISYLLRNIDVFLR